MSRELASGLAGIGRTHLSAIEQGQQKPALDTFCKIAMALREKPSALLTKIENEGADLFRSAPVFCRLYCIVARHPLAPA